MRIKLLIEQVGLTVRDGLFSPLEWLAACFLCEYLCEMTERKKTGCLGDGCYRQLGMLYPKSVIRISLCRTAKRNPLIFPI